MTAMTDKYTFIGRSMPRKDAGEIVTGKAVFIDDMKVPGMLYGKALRSPLPHADIIKIDTSEAKKLSGVRAVLTHENVPGWMGGTPHHIKVLDKRVRFVGDAVALVAAESIEQAQAALDLIKVEYKEFPAVYDLDEAIRPGASLLYEQFPQNQLPLEFRDFGPTPLTEIVTGDIEAGFASADIICEESCSYEGMPNPLPPEPPGLIISWEGENKLTMWSATQSVFLSKFITQTTMGFPDIRSIATYCGGSYGSKNFYEVICIQAAALAKAAARPVKMYYTKAEHLATFVLRPSSRLHCKVGIKKDGNVTAIKGDWIVGCGAYSTMVQGQICVGCGEAQLAIRCKNWDLKTRCVVTNRNPSGAVRGFGGQELKSALLPILSSAMEKIDMDPVEFYKKNFIKVGDGYYWRDGKWYESRVDYTKTMEKGADAFGWRNKWKGWLKPTSVEGPRCTGVGVGIHGNADVGEDRSEAYVRLNPDGTAVIHACVSECGAGQRNSLCRMTAEILQLPLERVEMTPPDTLVAPFDMGLIGSRGTYAVGSAVIKAARDAREKLLSSAAMVLNAGVEDLDMTDGTVYFKNAPEKKIPWMEITGPFTTFTGIGSFDPDHTITNFMIHFIEVAVDIETGKVDLLRMVQATDAGRIIDPAILNGQLYGSIGSGGVDSAVFEETIIDKKSGRILNANLIDYKWRTFAELPECQNVILESQLPTHMFKAVGVGEIATAPGPSAVLMAVSNAIGIRLKEYPLTPDRILKSLYMKKEGI
jgi:CO/xanthine dehydrogenase Mo-binding subunit